MFKKLVRIMVLLFILVIPALAFYAQKVNENEADENNGTESEEVDDLDISAEHDGK